MTVRHELEISEEEALRLTERAHAYRMSVNSYLGFVISHHALGSRLPPPPAIPRPKETQAEKRARLRALDPDGMSPYTREIQTIRPTTKESR